MVAGGFRAVERALALAAVEAQELAARPRAPQDSLRVDVAAADTQTGRRNVVNLRQLGLRIGAQEAGRAAEDADRVPDRAVLRMRHHGVRAGARDDALVL